ncbi:YezD family protein [Bacillus nakamurai]|uniref:YezD family protein n=1 Tax=Bacillus nakamurai TaxID=1793963 RepID=UPI0007DBFC32|nr:YezD family protein [Bacillus nakamurai]MCC9021996.1 YezD family protein [Bacillus nakamurai]MCP6681867.1 YezD family protein [Bacillus nakamurai]MED1226323.1 YezD family protein [Bacillus nakamurai]
MISKANVDPHVIEKIISALETIDFGTVQITVHNSQVTQIDKVEKYRFSLQSKEAKQKS